MNKYKGYEYIPLDDYKNYYYTNDFPLSVTLLCKGYELATIDQEGYGKYVLVFRLDKDINDVINNYWLHKVLVDPLEYENHRKNLKSRMFALFKK
jgi:hypothetical protein